MTKFEFSEKLRKALSGRVSHSIVNENVTYYERYIDSEIKKGRSEKEVLEELGDPRLLAKTIIDMAGEDAGGYVEESEGHTSGRAFSGKTYRIPLWVGLIILLLIIIVVFKIVGLVLGARLPIVLPILLIYWLVKYFRRN